MNYILEIKAFYDALDLNPMSSPEIALWHALMWQNNRSGWQKKFTVASSVLELRAGISRSALKRARNSLAQKGFIKWTQRKGRQAAEYEIIDLCVNSGPQSEPESGPQSEPESGPQSEPITKHKPKHKLSTPNGVDKAKPRKSAAVELIESWTQDQELRELLLEWLEVRKAQRAANTEGAIRQNLAKLPELAQQSGLSMQDYMREVIRRSWRAFYPIRDARQDYRRSQVEETREKLRKIAAGGGFDDL